MLEPEQAQPEQRNEDIHVEDDARIAWREVVFDDHVVDVDDGSSQHEEAGAKDGGKAQIEAAERGNEADDGKSETRRGDFELKGAVGPADKGGGHLAEQSVHHEIVEIEDTYGPEDVPGQELLDNHGRAHGLGLAGYRDEREEHSDDQECQGVVRQDKADRGADNVSHVRLPWHVNDRPESSIRPLTQHRHETLHKPATEL